MSKSESVFPPERVTLMGVVNVTPDSFSDGGDLLGTSGTVDLDRVLGHAGSLVAEGAGLLDVGGESTRPGSVAVSVDEEIERTAGAVAALRERFDAALQDRQ